MHSGYKSHKSAAYAFYADTGVFPCTKSGGWGEDPGFVHQITPANCWPNEGGCAAGCTDIPGWYGPYLEKWPQSGPWHLGGGGEYNWNRWSNYSPPGVGVTCSVAGIVTLEVYNTVPASSLRKIDENLDDGDLSTGYVFLVSGDRYLQFIVTCH